MCRNTPLPAPPSSSLAASCGSEYRSCSSQGLAPMASAKPSAVTSGSKEEDCLADTAREASAPAWTPPPPRGLPGSLSLPVLLPHSTAAAHGAHGRMLLPAPPLRSRAAACGALPALRPSPLPPLPPLPPDRRRAYGAPSMSVATTDSDAVMATVSSRRHCATHGEAARPPRVAWEDAKGEPSFMGG